MWRNYLTVGFRSLIKNRTYAFINIFGLALGLAACLLIMVYVRYETSFDRWIPGADRTHIFSQNSVDTESGNVFRFQGSAYVAGTMLKKDFPQIENLAFIGGDNPRILRDGRPEVVEDVQFTDSNFLEVVELPLVLGDQRMALANPGSLVVSETEARERFGTEDALGQNVTMILNDKPTDFRVTGVMRDIPRNSHMAMRMIARIDPQSYFGENAEAYMTAWGAIGGRIYVKLRPGADPAAIQSQLPAWEKRNIPNQTSGSQVVNLGDTDSWDLFNITDVHLGEAQDDAMTPGNSRSTITTFRLSPG